MTVRESVVPVVGKLRLITVSKTATDKSEWRTRVYDGSIAVCVRFGKTEDVAHKRAIEWIYENYDVLVSYELA